MPQIQVLDQITIDKIAAGEVIERPASIVKELVENSIDAKAASVTVEIQDGGISLIRVTDNGSGIEREDIRNAFLRHSTSKIRKVEGSGTYCITRISGRSTFQYLCGDQDGADHQDEGGYIWNPLCDRRRSGAESGGCRGTGRDDLPCAAVVL